MDASAGIEPLPQVSASSTPHVNLPRGGRDRVERQSALAFRPASVAPSPMSSIVGSSTFTSPLSNSTLERFPHKRTRGRGGRRLENRMVNGRQFGGQLTRQDTTSLSQSAVQESQQANVVTPVPDQHYASSKAHAKTQRRRMSKSQAPDVATRTHEDIDNGHYECPICTSEVRRNSKVWSCHTCWSVFHLACVKRWASNEGSTASHSQAPSGDLPIPRQWRCPGCNLPQDEMPKTYSCWCGKESDPRPAVSGLPPHSCGNTCGKERARKCPHPCELACHAGPCAPCGHMGPVQICFCGKHEIMKRCSETEYNSGWSCGEVCGDLMPCGEHTCVRSCHEGFCGACDIKVPARCFCGQVEKDILCDNREPEVESHRSHFDDEGHSITEAWSGSFNCGNTCHHTFDCGEHQCQKLCHSHGSSPEHCPRSPDMVSVCPCGKTPLAELTSTVRSVCTDDIPNCSEPCGKILACGHLCGAICHTGSCPSCVQTVDITCRCGRTTSRSICHQGKEEPPQCMRVCRTTLNCGRHACDEHCCSGERKAIERQGTKRKQRPIGASSLPFTLNDFEAEHICTRQCGRTLKCGSHECQDLCHRGSCGTCREAIFEDISCKCGRTVLQPPSPCGTKPPPCRYPCTRSKACGHPQVAHSCHLDDEACPKCPFLVERLCSCGKVKVKNSPCWLKDAHCGQVCGKKLRCGLHSCRNLCHASNECEDSHGQSCTQRCGKPKKLCEHPDVENTCHAPFPCREDKPCQSKIFITCQCQAQKQEVKCGVSKTTEGNVAKSLACNDECIRLERNRRLAVALNIDQSTHIDGGDHIPYSTETLNLFAANPKWCQTQEREFRVFAASEDERRLRFKPMKPQERSFIHALAEDFGLDSESIDPEPHRHVIIWKTPRFVSPPSKTLAEALRIRQAQRSAAVSANVSDNETTNTTKKTRAGSRQPYNAFILVNPRFGLTMEELRSQIEDISRAGFDFDIAFLANEVVLLRPIGHALNDFDVQRALQETKVSLKTSLSLKGYGIPELCTVDDSCNILQRESDSVPGDGWSQVAGKKAAPRFVPSVITSPATNAFSALSGEKMTFTKKKPAQARAKKEVIVDDWEAAEIAEEEKEKILIDESGGAKVDNHSQPAREDDDHSDVQPAAEFDQTTAATPSDSSAVVDASSIVAIP